MEIPWCNILFNRIPNTVCNPNELKKIKICEVKKFTVFQLIRFTGFLVGYWFCFVKIQNKKRFYFII